MILIDADTLKEKIIEKLTEYMNLNNRLEDEDYFAGEISGYKQAMSIVQEVAKEYATDTNVGSNGWIPCSERLPEEPEKTDDIEESIYIGRLTEYNVMIQGAKKATTLYYAGDGYWYDEASQECYPVAAWQLLPEPYREGE